MRRWFIGGGVLLWLGLAATAAAGPGEAEIFRKSVRPLLATRCFSCHADRVQLSGLRLDSREALVRGGRRGPALTPGDPGNSLLLRALRHEGDLKMPPAGKLSPAELAAVVAWVRAGAPWSGPGGGEDRLWALKPVVRSRPPAVRRRGWERTWVDRFVLARLEREGLSPSPEADRRTLLRRVSLDLTGLPPTPEAVEAFLADPAPNAYEKRVDGLLASPAYGERMAQHWLDLARYADSDGYHDDTTRLMWRYRDYVIQAFQRNKPFDQFTVEQLAGDLLPNATLEQKTASAFNRCGPTTSEGGAVPEEVLARYASERVNTTGQVWLGLTIQCAECHDHKYDPLTTRDYYQLTAFFNQVPEEALYRGTDAPPTLLIPTPEQQKQLDEMAARIAALEQETQTAAAGAAPTPEEKAQAEARAKNLAELKAARARVEREARLRVMADVPQRRPTYLLLRGDYRNRGGEVQPQAPTVLGSLPAGAAGNRLALARWLVDPKHPLTARVTVNRFWQMLFGAGLARSTDDLGLRGEAPSHPELLDTLAAEFVASGWDVKRLLRTLVLSATYRQSSRQSPELQKRDPQNRLLARGPRFRLPAEFIRDNTLAIAGLLDRERAPGGPSVRPYQPGDLWRELSAGDDASKSYVQDHGPDLYRRGLYTFWKRSILYPAFAVFDAPKREVCTGQRPITNTPLQAFVTLNDTAFVEAARVFAQRILKHGGVRFEHCLNYAFRVALARPPAPAERTTLERLYRSSLARYQADRNAAVELLSVGEAPRPPHLDPAEHAAWTCVANALLNLDETLTKE
ncbi:MAG: DUF1553 domain-containing protein [Armatimonadetes bacterium]|nr:DUF1553 domain-containing protein [Armatimonadota bacterium]